MVKWYKNDNKINFYYEKVKIPNVEKRNCQNLVSLETSSHVNN